MDAGQAALVIAAAAFALSVATAYAQLRVLGTRGASSGFVPVPYEGPDVGRKWPLATSTGSEIFIAMSKRCPSCVHLLATLRASFSERPLTLLVLGPPLEGEISAAWSVQTFSPDQARTQFGLVATPYAVVARAGVVAAHGVLTSAQQLEMMAG